MKRIAYLAAVFAGMWLMAAPLLAQESESRPDTGIIYGGQYVNSYFGFSYRFPAAWSANAGHPTMASRIYPLFSATPSGGGDGRFVAIQAEQLWQNGNVRTGRDFLAMSVGMLTGPSTGFEAIPGDKRYTISGREFDRIDLRSRPAPGAAMVRQALVATVVRDYAITFQFKASSDYELEDLVNTLQSLSFLDSVQASASPAAAVVANRAAPQPATSATLNPVAAAPAVSAPVRVAPQPVTVSHSANIAPVVSAPARPTVQPEATSAPAAGAPPSTLIKMASAPHTIPGETLPPTQLEPAPQPLMKVPPKSDPTTKTAVMQAVMPAPSAVLSPAALNTSATQPPASPRLAAPAQTVSTQAAPAQVAPAQAVPAPPDPGQSAAPVRKPAYITQTEITRVQISGEELEGYVIHKAPAMYPALARQARIEGLVVLSIVVDEKGNVQDVRAISGPALLARSAEDALRHWRFKPIMVDGKPTQVESKVSMNFQFSH